MSYPPGWPPQPQPFPPPAPILPAGPAPLDQPQYDATIAQAVTRFWRKYVVFSGRASRSEYWWWVLVSFVVSAVLQLIGLLIFGISYGFDPETGLDLSRFFLPLLPSLVWSVATLVPTIAVSVRRLHDTNRSGWWYLITLPTWIGLPFYLIGLGSLDPAQMSQGDFSGLAVGPLLAGVALMLVGAVTNIVLLVFFVLGPDPRGTRYDRRA